MALELVIPEIGEKKTVKDMIFLLLSQDESLTLSELNKKIKKVYQVSVSFQAVLKAVRLLRNVKVLSKGERKYSLNKDWIFETRNYFDKLYSVHFKVQKPAKRNELGEVIVYSIHNLLELDRIWNDFLMQLAKKEQHDKRNVWKGRHCWWLIPRLQEEDLLHDYFATKNIKTYNLMSQSTLLDKIACNYYVQKNEYAKVVRKLITQKDEHLGAFGEYIVKFEIPPELSRKIEVIYTQTKKITDLNFKKILDIFKEDHSIELTVIKDKFLADKVKEEIISYFDYHFSS